VRDIEKLARQMREEALAKTESSYERQQRAKREQEKQARLEQLKKLYFNAGRWAGGARDYNARKAFELINTTREMLQ
jgi:hypothetical protein